jgi:hypothetical protein
MGLTLIDTMTILIMTLLISKNRFVSSPDIELEIFLFVVISKVNK